MSENWYEIKNADEVPSPALLIYEERVQKNVRRMIEIIGDKGRLRPHIKTHKIPELMRMQIEQGITKYKCATIAEAEMAAGEGAHDILIAYQLVGPNIERFLHLMVAFPKVRFSCVADNAESLRALSVAAERFDPDRTSVASIFSPAKKSAHPRIEVLLDLDIGQHRTGIAPDANAFELYQLLAKLPGLTPGGLHAYDGHLHSTDVAQRTAECDAAFAPVNALRRQILSDGLPVPRVVTSGTPTFAIHARRPDVECSPGTSVFWDAGYGHKVPDLNFLPAAVLLTRVVSKPTPTRLCLDLGHKAVASEMPHPRVVLLNLPDATAVVHSEEHLVVETPHAAEFKVGDVIYGIPWHICPTVALHNEVQVVRNGRVEDQWQVTARARTLTI